MIRTNLFADNLTFNLELFSFLADTVWLVFAGIRNKASRYSYKRVLTEIFLRQTSGITLKL